MATLITREGDSLKFVQGAYIYIVPPVGVIVYQRDEDPDVIAVATSRNDRDSIVEFRYDDTNLVGATPTDILDAIAALGTGSGATDPNTGAIKVATEATATNTGNTATNTGTIATNTGNTATNTGTTATNTGTTATNTGTIATNTGNTATNTAGIKTDTAAIKLEQLTPTQKTVVARFLRFGTVKNAIGNYAAATDFIFDPAIFGASTKFVLMNLLAYVKDGGNMDSDKYGAGNLVNGIKIYVQKNGVELDLLDAEPILFNQQWDKHGWNTSFVQFNGGDRSLQAKVHFSTLFGYGIVLDAALGDRVIVRLQDNLTFLLEHYFKCAGYVQ